jgi:hypothetical protein
MGMANTGTVSTYIGSGETATLEICYRLRKWENTPIGGWTVHRADNGRRLGWLTRSSSDGLWDARVAEEAFRGTGPDDTGDSLDDVPDHLIRTSHVTGGQVPVAHAESTRDSAAANLLSYLHDHRAPAVGYGRHYGVRRWADR